MRHRFVTSAAAVLLLAMVVAPAFAGTEGADDAKKMSEEAQRVKNATATLNEILKIPEKGIPSRMLENCAGVVVIPGLVKAGFIAGARHGSGVLSIRREDGTWSYPMFVKLTGGSIGWQAGIKKSDLVLVFMSRRNIDDIINGEFTLGGDVGVAAGPVGRTGGAGMDIKLNSGVYAYARSRGVFAGISLDGSKIYVDKDANVAFYGDDGTTENIMNDNDIKENEVGAEFVATLAAGVAGNGKP